MTRINVGIDPSELPRKALLSEHKEITRVPNAVRSGRAKLCDIPDTFRLNKGHIKFFYDKLLYLNNRYASLLAECIKRGYNVTDKTAAFFDLPDELMNDYIPTAEDRELLLERLEERGHTLRRVFAQ